MTQTIEANYVLKSGNAAQELARLHAAEDKLGAVSGKAAQGVAQLDHAIGGLGARTLAGTKGLDAFSAKTLTLGEQMKGLQGKLAAGAGGIAAMSVALGNGESKAAKYGQAFAGIAGAFASGGPKAAVLAAGVVAIEAITKALNKGIDAQDALDEKLRRSTDSYREFRDAISAAHFAMNDELNLSMALSTATSERNAKIVERQILLGRQMAMVQRELAAATNDQQRTIAQGALNNLVDDYAKIPVLVDNEEKRARAAERWAKAQADGLAAAEAYFQRTAGVGLRGNAAGLMGWDRRSVEGAWADPETGAISNIMGGGAFEKTGLGGALDQVEESRHAKLMREQDMQIAAENESLDRQERVNEMRIESDQRRFDRQEEMLAAASAVEARYWGGVVDMAQSSSALLLSTAQDYFAMKLAGEKNAELIATATFLKGQGEQLVGAGLRGIFEGAIISANPLTPGAGAGMVATGLLAVGTGMAMGAAGAGISANLPGGGGGSGRIRDVNTAPRRRLGGGSSSTGSSSTSVINITYGGPTGKVAEDVARDTLKAIKRIGRRGAR